MGVPPVIIYFHELFPYKPSSELGGTPIDGYFNLHIKVLGKVNTDAADTLWTQKQHHL